MLETLQERSNTHLRYRIEMWRVKIIIDKEAKAFDDALRDEFRKYWRWQQPQERFVLLNNDVATTSCLPIISNRSETGAA